MPPCVNRCIRITVDRVAFIDWDESRVDVPDLDLVLPHNVAGLDGSAHDIAAQAATAWDAAVCWDNEFSIKRLAEVRAVRIAAPKFARTILVCASAMDYRCARTM